MQVCRIFQRVPRAPILQPRNINKCYFDKSTAIKGESLAVPMPLEGERDTQDVPQAPAVDREVEQLKHLGTYELAQCPPDCKPIGCEWVFRLKRNATGAIVKYKAQLVAQGFAQKPASIMSKHSRPLYGSRHCAPSLPLDLDIHVIDVVSVYLNGELQEEIYMRQPPMYENGQPATCRLHRTLYGLKQSGSEWNLKLDTAFVTLGFTRLLSDQCVYRHATTDHLALVAVHVDDMTMLTSSPADSDTLTDKLEAHFELSKLGNIRQVVGLEVDRDRTHGTLMLRQAQYIAHVLEHFGMALVNPVNMPLDVNVHLVRHDGPKDPSARSLYQASWVRSCTPHFARARTLRMPSSSSASIRETLAPCTSLLRSTSCAISRARPTSASRTAAPTRLSLSAIPTPTRPTTSMTAS